MLSPYERETLGDLVKEIRTLNRLGKRCDTSLERLVDSISGKVQAQESPVRFSDSEIERLMKLNRRLGEIEAFERDIAHELWPGLIDKIKNSENLMGDFEIDMKIDFKLREDDTEVSEDSDNILTTREDCISYPDDETVDKEVVDYREPFSETSQLAAEPHCYLFHDLYDHSYGEEQPSVPLRDCLRIGKLQIEVIVRQQYYLDLETGKWDKSCGNRKLEEFFPAGCAVTDK